MLNAIRGQDEIDKIWVRRGTFKKGATRIPVDSIDHFDIIIENKKYKGEICDIPFL